VSQYQKGIEGIGLSSSDRACGRPETHCHTRLHCVFLIVSTQTDRLVEEGNQLVPAQIVIVHDDESFLLAATDALKEAGYEVAPFDDPMVALDVLAEARAVQLLVTRVEFAPGKPHGIALAAWLDSNYPASRCCSRRSHNTLSTQKDWGSSYLYPSISRSSCGSRGAYWRRLRDRSRFWESTLSAQF